MKLRWRVILTCGFLLMPSLGWSTVYWVAATGGSDAGTTCANADGPTDPGVYLRTIQRGVNCATAAGDVVNVKSGTYIENVTNWPASGSAGNPIIVQAHPGDSVTVRSALTGQNDQTGAFRILDRSYIRIQGITFDGTTERVALRVLNSTHSKSATPIVGIEILNKTFSNNGNQAGTGIGDSSTIYLHSVGRENSYSGTTPLNEISGNTFSGNYGHDILLLDTSDTLVENNISSGVKGSCNCVWGFYEYQFIKITTDMGPEPDTNAWRNIVQANTISNFVRSAYDNLNMEATAIRLDVNCDYNTIRQNVVHDIGDEAAWSASRRAYGIYIENGSDNNLIEENIFYNIGEASVRLGSGSTVIVSGNQIINNVFYANGELGILLHTASSTVVRNNIVMDWTKAGIYVTDNAVTGGGHTFSDNLYYKSGTTNIGRWNEPDGTFPFAAANLTLAQWNTASGETSSQSEDPQFINPTTDFHLQSDSPACGAGFDGLDLGAYPDEPNCPGGGDTDPPAAPTNFRRVRPG